VTAVSVQHEAPLVSVVVPVRNGGRALMLLVEALASQTLGRDRFEVIVADDGSTDGALDRVAPDGSWLRVLRLPRATSYRARNAGVEIARGLVLAFCDADCRPEPEWLELALSTIEHAEVAAGRIRFVVPARPTVWTLLDVDTFLNQERAVLNGKAATANLLIRRSVFDELGGFDPALGSTGDYDFVDRAVRSGARLVYSQDAAVWHPTRDTARSFLRKVWRVNRWHAIRKTRAGWRAFGTERRLPVPVVGTVRARRSAGRPLGLDLPRLRREGLEPTRLARLAALAVLYLVVPAVRAGARLAGWLEVRLIRAGR
jgi:glycosyltransferase involved in cell wall biosynthesis